MALLCLLRERTRIEARRHLAQAQGIHDAVAALFGDGAGYQEYQRERIHEIQHGHAALPGEEAPAERLREAGFTLIED